MDSEKKDRCNNNKIVCSLFLIRIGLSALFLSLNFVWIYPIKNNSNKEEPSADIRSSLISNSYSNSKTLENSDADCDVNLQNFIENGAYETFNIKMTNIQKYSKIFITLLFIQVGINGLAIIILFLTSLAIIYTTIDEIIAIINTIIFIILSVNYYKGKYDDFENFSECYFLNKEEFRDTYQHIFIIQKNFKKFFILNIVFICFNCFANCCLSCITRGS